MVQWCFVVALEKVATKGAVDKFDTVVVSQEEL